MKDLSGMTIQGNESLMIIDNLLSRKECHDLIAKANSIVDDTEGNKAWHYPGTGGKYMRVIMIDTDLATDLWNRIKPYLPTTYRERKLLYLNNYFRFSRYREGGLFPVHCDGKNYDAGRPELTNGYSSESLFTLNIFLNDSESVTEPLISGGATDFFNQDQTGELVLRYSAQPKAGRAALFWADQYHRGNPVDKGFKYLLRTDVMGILA